MKGSKSLIVISIAVTLAIIPSAIAAPKTTLKAAGRVTTPVVNTILNGVGVPAKTIGIDGDFYIDTKNLNLYGPKIKGAWKIGTSLKQTEIKSVSTVIGEGGAVGEKGDKGATGNTGATGSAGLIGIPGVAGVAGAKGSDGAPGAAGMTGATGLTGSAGVAGTAGSNGTNGAAGASGSQGIQGVKGDNGAQGIQGITGSKGDAGATGAAGVTSSYYVDLGAWTLYSETNSDPSDSNSFGSLDVGFYTFEIMADGVFSPNTTAPMTIGMQLIASAGTVDYRVFASDSVAYINGYGNRHFQFLIIGKIVCTGATSLKLRAVDPYGATSSNLLNFTGRALINKVGTIG